MPESNDVMIMTNLFTSNYLCLSTRARTFDIIEGVIATSIVTAFHNFFDLPSIYKLKAQRYITTVTQSLQRTGGLCAASPDTFFPLAD